MDKMREEFEAWCANEGFGVNRYQSSDYGDKYKHLVGDYVMHETNIMWLAWQASRNEMISNLITNGLALVPTELTQGMREAFHEANDEWEAGGLDSPDHQWGAMLAASKKFNVASNDG